MNLGSHACTGTLLTHWAISPALGFPKPGDRNNHPKGLISLGSGSIWCFNVIWLSTREFLYWKRTCSYFFISLHSNFPSDSLGTWVLVQTQTLFPLLLPVFPSSISPSQATRTLAARTPKWYRWARIQVGNFHYSSCPSNQCLQTYSLSCCSLPAGASFTPPPFSGDAFGVNPRPPSSLLKAFSVFPPRPFPLPFATHWSAKTLPARVPQSPHILSEQQQTMNTTPILQRQDQIPA